MAVVVASMLAGTWLLWRLPRPRACPSSATGVPERVSVVIPARNEAGALPGLLASLAGQNRRAEQVIVVDDHSEDAPGGGARVAGAAVGASPALPGGWTGKTWACHHGAQAATGEVLVFLDADVTLAPEALSCLLDEHRRRGGLVSVQPYHRTGRRYEQLSAVCNVVALMGTGAFSPRPPRRLGMAFGPCLVIGRADYERAGGHAHPGVRHRITEDIGLAERMRADGRPVTIFAGRDLVSFRMYPDGPGQLVEGWSKMLATGAREAPPLAGMATAAWVTGGLVVSGRVVRAAARRRLGRSELALYGGWAAQMWWMLRRVGDFGPLTAAAFPLPLMAFVGLCLRSGLVAAGGAGLSWKGRTLRT
ncbi:MAG: glycosyltransferase family 2 protein [Acidimicrobiales bacterium]